MEELIRDVQGKLRKTLQKGYKNKLLISYEVKYTVSYPDSGKLYIDLHLRWDYLNAEAKEIRNFLEPLGYTVKISSSYREKIICYKILDEIPDRKYVEVLSEIIEEIEKIYKWIEEQHAIKEYRQYLYSFNFRYTVMDGESSH